MSLPLREESLDESAGHAGGAETPSVWLLAATAGAAVANLYYNQPLLPEIGHSFGVSDGRTGFVSTATQIGYAIGLLLFVPLGDVLERRRLMIGLLVAVALSLGGAAAAPTLGILVLASLAIGVTTIVPQLVIPFGAGLVGPEQRGRIVGRIMGGLLIGILAARVVAGVVGSVIGWRAMFAVASVLMLLLALALARALSPSLPATRMRYTALLRSLGTLTRDEPVLRDASVIGALVFLAFSAFWTTLAFRLLLPPLHYGSSVAGMFGLVGIVGASAAPLVGRLADVRTPRSTVGIGLILITLSFLLFLFAGHTLSGLVAGVIILDAGMQTVGVSNQARIYRLPEPLHNRLNTIYMVSYFVGGSIGSALGVWAWRVWRWNGVCMVGIGALVIAGAVYEFGRHRLAA
jgi:predicted MFS family arabinose efflux permease